jgi:hypothetical protein
MKEPQLSVGELLRRTDDIEYLLDVVQNGHPSIDDEHFCYDDLQILQDMEEDDIITMYNDIHK